MLVPQPKDALHKRQLITLLRGVLTDPALSNALYLKGGTYAALMGYLNRFSVDLDFDILTSEQKELDRLKVRLHKLFAKLDLSIADESQHYLQFFLKYKSSGTSRNTLKLEVSDRVSPYNEYEVVTLKELGLVCRAQTLSTMVANKLVAALNRQEQRGSVAGRDFFDIREFLSAGLPVNQMIIEERMGIPYAEYVGKLLEYVETVLTPSDLYVDLNSLLPPKNFRHVVDQIIPDLKMLLQDELVRVKEGYSGEK